MAENPKNDDQLKKGSAAPLEGAVGPEVAGLLNFALGVISLGMLQNLGMGITNTLSNTMGLNNPASPTVAKTPNPFEMKMPSIKPPSR